MAERIDRIVEVAERLFGEPVIKVTAPGGKGRASYRLFLEGRTVIATWRPNFRRTHLEAYVLQALTEFCDDVPEYLGLDGEILFQSDVGARRLNAEMARRDEAGQRALAGEAVASIFRIHMAARQTDLHRQMPHLGANPDWVRSLVASAEVLDHFGPGTPGSFDPDAVASALTVPCTQFLKWDCRSGNAALDPFGTLRWFDFEYSGVRHGAEDFAWLIGDEAWPRQPDEMLAIVRDAYPRDYGHDWEDFAAYLALYTTFHAIQRFRLIVREAARRGWISPTKTLTYDDAGVHPAFAAHICRVGAFFAERNRETRMLVPGFEAAARVFAEMLDEQRRAAG